MHIPPLVQEFMSTIKKVGFEVYIVGGAVRALLLNKETDNWDFTTNAKPDDILQIFPDAFYHNTYGTVTVPIDNPPELKPLLMEITPFRKEAVYQDNRRPSQVEWTQDLKEDLSRRDFTINAMATQGTDIIDPFEGLADWKNKIVRAVGDPDKRFKEDALRLLRAVRFACQLGFLIEEKTFEAIQINSQLIQHISWERIRDEFLKIVSTDHPSEGVLLLKNTGLLQFILPELQICFSVDQKSPQRHHIYDVGTHLINSLKYCPSNDPITRFATLIHDIGKEKTYRKDEKTQIITFYNHEVVGEKLTKEIARRFRLSNKQSEKLIRLVGKHQFTVTEELTDNALRRFIREVGKEYLQDMLDLRTADRLGSGSKETSWRTELFKKRLEEVQHEPFAVKDLKINGKDVMEVLQIPPSPKVGEVLETLFNKVVEKVVENEREILLKELLQYKI
ncbi:MAG: HD domain-containing protein [Candidatus Roizmanbacteria bacterium]